MTPRASCPLVVWGLAFGAFVALLALSLSAQAEEEPVEDETPLPAATPREDSPSPLPAASAERRPFSEPLGPFPAPWPALSARLDGGATVDGRSGWTAARVHVPVVRQYGSVDARLAMGFDSEGITGIDPELLLRAIPLQLVDRRATFGAALGVAPGMNGPDPLMDVFGGLLGGYLGRSWLLRGYLGARGEVLERATPARLEANVAAGLLLPLGFRPLLEVDLLWDIDTEDFSLGLRPGLRYWPLEWLGIGVSADLWAVTPDGFQAALRLDFVAHALE